jgi:hypothetical protein
VHLKKPLSIPSYQQDILPVQAATLKGGTVNFSPAAAKLVAPDGTVLGIHKSGKLHFLNSIVNNTEETAL